MVRRPPGIYDGASGFDEVDLSGLSMEMESTCVNLSNTVYRTVGGQ